MRRAPMKPGDRVRFDDGAHFMNGEVDGWFANGLIVWFDGRASSATIFATDQAWLNYLVFWAG